MSILTSTWGTTITTTALRIAINVVIQKVSSNSKQVDKEINKAYKKALKDWCRNWFIRRRKSTELKLYLDQKLKKENVLEREKNSEYSSFLSFFEKRIAERASAYNYLRGIKDDLHHSQNLDRHDQTEISLQEIKKLIIDSNGNNTVIANLEKEWANQAEFYRESLNQLKPTTAITFLLKMEERFDQENISVSDELRGNIIFLKSQCYSLTGSDKYFESCIQAYKYLPTNTVIKERAAIANFKAGNIDLSKSLMNDLLSSDDKNPIGWIIKVLSSGNRDLIVSMSEVPKEVLSQPYFRRFIFFYSLSVPDLINRPEALEKYSILMSAEDFKFDKIDLGNFFEAIFIIESSVSRLIAKTVTGLHSNVPNDLNETKKVEQVLSSFLTFIENSEIKDQYILLQFWRDYLYCTITKDATFIAKIRDSFLQYDGKHSTEIFAHMFADFLQMNGDDNGAISILESMKYRDIRSNFLLSLCYYKIEDDDKFINSLKTLIIETKKVEIFEFQYIMELIIFLFQTSKISEIEKSDFLKLQFAPFDLSELFVAVIECLYDPTSINKIERLKNIPSQKSSYPENVRLSLIGTVAHLINQHELAIECFRKSVDTKIETRELYYYILSLEKSGENSQVLMNLLTTWRKKFAFMPAFCKIELQHLAGLTNWEGCIEVCEYYFKNRKFDEMYAAVLIHSLHNSLRPNRSELIKKYVNLYKNESFKRSINAQRVAAILIKNNAVNEGFDILYPHAINLQDPGARTTYFTLYLEATSAGWEARQKGPVKMGDFVRLEDGGGNRSYVQVAEENSVTTKLIGKNEGDNVETVKPMTQKIEHLKIIRILNKYSKLSCDIMDQADSNPALSGLPFESIKIEGNKPEDLIRTLLELGKDTGERDNFVRKSIDEFNKNEISFTEVVIRCFESDFINGYFTLATQEKGFKIIPRNSFSSNLQIAGKTGILDFSSLLIYFITSQKHNAIFTSKFYISPGTVHLVKEKLEDCKSKVNDQHSFNIVEGKVTRFTRTKEMIGEQVKFLEDLLNWIQNNCEVKIAVTKLDLTRKLLPKVSEELFVNYLTEIVSILNENPNSVIISDDKLFYQFVSIENQKIVSSEFFLGTLTNWNPDIFSEYLVHKYSGLWFQ